MSSSTLPYDELRVSDDTPTTPVHVERIKCGSRSVFDEEHYRRWHVMGVRYDNVNKRCRFLIPLGLGEGESDEGEGLRIPVLAGASGKGCLVQVRDGVEKVPYKRRDRETGEIVEDEYERIIWRTIAQDCHHPVLGKMVVVIEPAVMWQATQDEDGSPKIVLTWEDESENARLKSGFVPGDPQELLATMRDDLRAFEQDLRHETDEVIADSLRRDIDGLRRAIRDIELNVDAGTRPR